jgi:RNA polymerase sigma-70 factor (ECF subfamily)
MLKSEADLDLLNRYAIAGDPDAFGEIVQRYTAMVYHTCLRVLHDKALAEDASQDTFYRLMCSPGTVNRSVGAWLHRTATRRSLDVLRSDTARAQRERVYSNDYYHGRANPPSWSVLSPKIDEALALIEEPMRSLLIEHFLAGKSQRQLAKENRTSTATICRRIKEGLEELRKHLKGMGLIVAGAAMVNMLSSQTTLAAPPRLDAELGKMSMVSGDPAAFGSQGIHSGGMLMKAGTIVVCAVILGAVFYGLAQIGNGPASVTPPPPRESIQATTPPPPVLSSKPRSNRPDPADPTVSYIIPQKDMDFDSRKVSVFQMHTRIPDEMVNVGFADGHVVPMRVDEAIPLIEEQTGQKIDVLVQTLPYAK